MRQKHLSAVYRLMIVGLLIQSLGLAAPAPAAAADQNAYRWRNDDGDEATATWMAAENTPANVLRGTPTRLRFGINHDANDKDVTDTLRLNAGDDGYYSTAFDSATNYLYVGTAESPGRILRFDVTTGPPYDAPDSIALSTDENNVYTALLDTSGGYGYFVTSTVPSKVIKVQLSTFTRVGTLTLAAGENYVAGGTIYGGYMYLLTRTDPGKIVKVKLADFTEQTGLTTSEFLTYNYTSPVANDNKLYLADGNNYITKFDISSPATTAPSLVGTLSMTPDAPYDVNPVYRYAYGLAVDTTNDVLYSSNYYGLVHKINIAGGTTFSYTATLGLSVSALNGQLALDQANGKLYVGSYNPYMSKVDLATFTQDTYTTSLPLYSAAQFALSGDGSKLYETIDDNPAHIVQIATSDLSAAVDYTGTSSGDDFVYTSVVDTSNHKGYFATVGSVNRGDSIIQVDLDTMTRTGRIDLPSGYTDFYASAIDVVGRKAYFIDYTAPSHLVRVDLDSFTWDELDLPADGPYYYHYDSMTLDPNPSHHYLYLASYGVPTAVTQVNLDTFTRGSSVSLFKTPGDPHDEDRNDGAMSLDTVNDKLYVGAGSGAGYVVRLDVSGSNLARETALLTPGETFSYGSAIDPANGFLYLLTGFNDVVKINIAGGTTLSIVDTAHVGTDDDYTFGMDIDTTGQYLYVGGAASPGKVFRVELAPFAYDPADDVAVPNGEESVNTVIVDHAAGYFYYASYEAPSLVGRVSIENKKQYRLEYAPKVTTCSSASYTQVATGNDWVPADSANVSNGTATTDNGLTDPAGTFKPGFFTSFSGQATGVRTNASRYTEMEYSLKALPTTAPGDYCFRLSDAGSTGVFTFSEYAEATLKTNDPTLSNQIHLGRLAAGATGDVAISFQLQNTLSGTLTVTFPSGFTVMSMTGAGSTACLSGFSFDAQHLYATKTNCSGTIVLAGATVQNPSLTGVYHISWVNDDPGGGDVIIIGDDGIVVSSTVDPSITFDVGADTGSCSGAFTGSGGTVAFGALSPTAVSSSDAGGVAHICTRVTTNAASGATVTVASKNAELKSASSVDFIPSTGGTIGIGTENYGLCAGSAGGDNGEDTTSPVSAAPARIAPFDGASCTSSGHDTGALTTAAQSVWQVTGASQNAFFRLYVKASISPTTPAHADYGDTLTFVATGLF